MPGPRSCGDEARRSTLLGNSQGPLVGLADTRLALAMQPFPPASELSHLIGDSLEQVRLDPYSTQFLFERTKILAVLALEHVEPDGTEWRYENVADQSGPSLLHRLVGDKVRSLQVDPLRLTIEFESGALLRLFADLEPYEAGTIDGPGSFIVF